MASHLAGLGNIRDMSREDVAKLAADAYAAVKERAEEMIAERQKPRPFASSRRFERIALVMMVHGETASALKMSTDGDESKAQWLPKSQVELNSEHGGFVYAIMPGWLVIDRKFMQATSPQLTKSREWTTEQQQAWKRLCMSIERGRVNQYGDKWKRRIARTMKISRDRPRPR